MMPDGADASNHEQAAYWNGEVGQRWTRRQTVLDAMFAPLTDALFERAAPAPGERVLDVGCGSGETALRAARLVGTRGGVVAADLSQPLLALARERATREAAGAAPIDWLEADAQGHDFGQARFAHVLSRFGVMFFADTAAAFANLHRALTSAGRLTFLCWRAVEANDWVRLPYEVVARLVPDLAPPAPPGAPGPFRFADAAIPARALEAAGFRDVACEPVDRPLLMGRAGDGSDASAAAAAAAETAVDLGPVARLLRERDPALREAARAAVAEALLPHAADGTVRLGGACWLVSARR